ncbi:hypothetical protein CFOL_v3_05155 [Cephalotus follicularis]|uniref:Uncharacterized protein n=1 Tax=Cephalotus follicularis TaxID=3775 RepID=A0A1Q3B0Y1_CEPFO|nr:hypothetical protein CFOL_v3_05155 [Cephalotus follicularis]
MAFSFTRFSWWPLKSGGAKEREPVSNGSSLNSSTEWGLGLNSPSDTVKCTTRIASFPKKVKKKWQSREQRRIDREHDVVLVPSDGVGLSGSDSDDSDWSIGWLEPHGPDFNSDKDDKSDDSFAVLVPCYRPGCKEVVGGSNHQILSAIKKLPNESSSVSSKLSTKKKCQVPQNVDVASFFSCPSSNILSTKVKAPRVSVLHYVVEVIL